MAEELATGLEIAVIGMAGRFPGAGNIAEFWDNLKNGIESITSFTDEELRESGLDPGLLENPNYVKANGMMEGIEYFDASFFAYTPKEVQLMEPQTRIFHECVWTALEDAGYDPGSYEGLIGLYAGATPNFGWIARALMSGKYYEIGSFEAGLLTQKDYLSVRISYKLNLTGPSFVLYTACSTSLVTIHQASQGILNGECDMALAGGVTISKLDKRGYMYQEGMIGSPDGHCRAFDAGAKGIVAGDGAGVVVLKRLEDAISDRDHIYCVIKGSAINNDGKRKAGFTAASVEGQAEVIKMALQLAEVEPESIGYIETHGTGTALGDPVEIEGLKIAFNTDRKGFCAIGSVKTNVGHLDSAAGVTGFIKTALALKYKLIPPSLHFQIPNPNIDFINCPFYVNTTLTQWENETGKYPLRAGVSSFGIGGTNAHVILEEAPYLHMGREIPSSKSSEYQLILLSAGTEAVLKQMVRNLADHFKKNPHTNLAEAAYTLQVGRKAFKHRWMAVCSSLAGALEALTSSGTGETHVIGPEGESSFFEKMEPGVGNDVHSLTRIGRLWLRGKKIDWKEFHSHENLNRILLPTYPFEVEGRRYWIEGDVLTSGLERMKGNSQSSQNSDIGDWFYAPSWKCSVVNHQKPGLEDAKRCLLVFVNELNLGKLLLKEFNKQGGHVVAVKIGHEFKRVGDDLFTINPRESSHYDALFAELRAVDKMPDNILHLWNVTGECDTALGFQSFDDAQYLGFYSLLNMVKTIERQDADHNIRLFLLTDYVQDVVGEEPLCPEKAVVLGLLKVIPQEYPGISCRSIDILLPEPGGEKEKKLVDLLVDECTDNSVDTVVAYRNSRRWVQIFEPLHLEEPRQEHLGLREGGVYLVTGGLGKIGLMFSELLVKHSGATLILTGRSSFPPKEEWQGWLDTHGESNADALKIKKLQELERLGGKVLYIRADVADYQQMQDVVRKAEETFGEINGMIHSAGVIEGDSMRSIRELSDNDCRLQFQAKVYGTLVLQELFKDKVLDFCWMLSSISCVLGGLGFGAYSSSNLFMDLLVKKYNHFHPGGNRWFSLNWDGVDHPTSITAFERLFSLEKPDQLVFSRGGDLQTRIDQWITLETVRDETHEKVESTAAFHQRPNISGTYVAPRNTGEKIIAGIWQVLLGYREIGVQDDFLELGGDSLKAITLIARIYHELNVNIPVTEFFRKPTVEGIAQYISGKEIDGTYESIEPAEVKEFYPVSSAQRRIYILYQMRKESKSYNIPTVLRVRGELSLEKLKKTFQQLIKRHESLRTSFITEKEGPVQIIHDNVEFNVEYYESGEEESRETIENFVRPFDLSKAPLLRVGLIKTDEAKYLLMVDMYHIISDGVSYAILVKDFISSYNGEELPTLKIQYKDFSEWQNRCLRLGKIDIQKEYWLSRYKGADIPVLNMPLDYPRPAVRNVNEGDSLSFRVNKEIYRKLHETVKQTESTLFMFLFAVYYILLAKYSKQEDIVVGTLVTGRGHADLEKVLGIFVNTIPQRNYPEKNKTVKQFLGEVKNNALEAYGNQEYSFDELIIDLGLQGDSSRNPLFDTVFTLNIFKPDDVSLEIKKSDIEFGFYGNPSRFAKFDLYFEASEVNEEISILVRYSTQLFKLSTIRKIAKYYIEILEQVTGNISVMLKDITLSHDLVPVKARADKNDGNDFGF